MPASRWPGTRGTQVSWQRRRMLMAFTIGSEKCRRSVVHHHTAIVSASSQTSQNLKLQRSAPSSRERSTSRGQRLYLALFNTAAATASQPCGQQAMTTTRCGGDGDGRRHLCDGIAAFDIRRLKEHFVQGSDPQEILLSIQAEFVPSRKITSSTQSIASQNHPSSSSTHPGP